MKRIKKNTVVILWTMAIMSLACGTKSFGQSIPTIKRDPIKENSYRPLTNFVPSPYMTAVNNSTLTQQPMVLCNQGKQTTDDPYKPQLDWSPSDEADISVFAPQDPNEIIGTVGYDAPGDSLQWVSVAASLPYTIYFENDPSFATAAAQKVEIRMPLHAKADIANFAVGTFGFGSHIFAVEGNYATYQQRLDLAEDMGLYVDVVAGIDVVTNEAFWIFESIDPATDLPPQGTQEGFLPINDESHNGEGFVTFTISPKASACVTGDVVTAMASIVFDINEPLSTNVWHNTVDALPPTTQLTGHESNSNELLLQFSGTDDQGGCGLKQYKLYVSDNFKAYSLYNTYTVDSEATFPTEYEHCYRFFCLGEDNVGHVEKMKEEAEYEYGNYNLLITVTASPNDGGTVEGGGYFIYGANATVVATPYPGYNFDRWSYNGMTVSTESLYTFRVEDNRELVANFTFDGTLSVQSDCLTYGWNWWSSHIAMNTENDFMKVKNALGTDGITIKSQYDGFVSYLSGDWYGNLNSINNNEMFMIQMETEHTLNVSGILVDGENIPITINADGWSWIGYPMNTTQEINAALTDLTPTTNDILKARDNFSTYYPGLGWIGSLTSLTPGYGYMYQSQDTESKTFHYSNSRMGNPVTEKPRDYHWVTSVNQYAENATLVGWVSIDGIEQRSEQLEVGAFVGEHCVGHTYLRYVEPLDRYLLFLTYYGQGNDIVSFRLYDAESSYEYGAANEEIAFAANSMTGTLEQPYLISFGVMNVDEYNYGGIVMFPNPVRAKHNFKTYITNATDEVCSRVEIFNTLGMKVYSQTCDMSSMEIMAPAAAGIYIVRIISDDGRLFSGKLIVE